MKVIHINHYSSSTITSDYEASQTKDWYARTAFALKKRFPKYEVECWAPEIKYKKEKTFVKNGVKFRIFPSTFHLVFPIEYSQKMIKALKKELRQNPDTVIHLHEYHTLHAYIIALLHKKHKIVAQHHGAKNPLNYILRYKLLTPLFPFLLILELIERHALKKISVFFCLNQQEVNHLKKFIKRAQIKFQPMGTDDFFFSRIPKKKARQELINRGYDISHNKLILYVGRLVRQKGIQYLIKSISNLPEDLKKETKLFILGVGPYQKKLEHLIKKHKINAVFTGFLGKERKLFYAASDLFVLPSLNEGFGVVLVEALASNTQVIGTNVGGIPSIILPKKNGYIVPVKDTKKLKEKIELSLRHPLRNVSKYAEKYSWDTIIKNTEKYYRL